MTPPVSTGKSNGVNGAPLLDQPLPKPSQAKDLPAPADSYVPMNGDENRYKSLDALIEAIRDEALFTTSGNAVYQKERNKKYLKVTLALVEIRKYLRKDETNAYTAAAKIEEWLKVAELLTDTAVAGTARKNLVAALKRAPQGEGIDEGVKAMLGALQKNYGVEAPPVAAPAEKPKAEEKAPASFADSLSDVSLLGDKYSDFQAKRNKEYIRVNLALVAVRKFARGEGTTDAAKTEIVAWLEKAELLRDPVALHARKALIKALGAAPAEPASLAKGAAELVTTLKADYSKAAPPPAPATVETAGSTLKSIDVRPNSTPKAARDDDAKTLANGLQRAISPVFERALKKYGAFGLGCTLTIRFDQKSGHIFSVNFSDIKVSGDLSNETVKDLLTQAANSLRSRFSFVKTDGSDFGIIKAPVKFVAVQSK